MVAFKAFSIFLVLGLVAANECPAISNAFAVKPTDLDTLTTVDCRVGIQAAECAINVKPSAGQKWAAFRINQNKACNHGGPYGDCCLFAEKPNFSEWEKNVNVWMFFWDPEIIAPAYQLPGSGTGCIQDPTNGCCGVQQPGVFLSTGGCPYGPARPEIGPYYGREGDGCDDGKVGTSQQPMASGEKGQQSDAQDDGEASSTDDKEKSSSRLARRWIGEGAPRIVRRWLWARDPAKTPKGNTQPTSPPAGTPVRFKIPPGSTTNKWGQTCGPTPDWTKIKAEKRCLNKNMNKCRPAVVHQGGGGNHGKYLATGESDPDHNTCLNTQLHGPIYRNGVLVKPGNPGTAYPPNKPISGTGFAPPKEDCKPGQKCPVTPAPNPGTGTGGTGTGTGTGTGGTGTGTGTGGTGKKQPANPKKKPGPPKSNPGTSSDDKPHSKSKGGNKGSDKGGSKNHEEHEDEAPTKRGLGGLRGELETDSHPRLRMRGRRHALPGSGGNQFDKNNVGQMHTNGKCCWCQQPGTKKGSLTVPAKVEPPNKKSNEANTGSPPSNSGKKKDEAS